jgi:hypothetical protein
MSAKKGKDSDSDSDDETGLECAACGKQYSRKDALLRHLRTKHRKETEEPLAKLFGGARKKAAHAVSKVGRYKNPVTVTAPEKGEVEVEGGETEEDDEEQAPEAGSIAARGPFAAPKSVPVAVPRGLGDPPRGRRYSEDDGKRSASHPSIPDVVFVEKKISTVTYHGHTRTVKVGKDGEVKVEPLDIFQTFLGPSPHPGKNPEDIYASPDGRFRVNGRVYRFTPDGKKVMPEVRSAPANPEARVDEKEVADSWPFFSAIGFNDDRKRLAGSTPALVEGAEGPAPAKKTHRNFLGLTFEDRGQKP